MQHQDGFDLRREWGNKPCKHKRLEAEYFGEVETGDYLCKRCGRVFEAHDAQTQRRNDDDE